MKSTKKNRKPFSVEDFEKGLMLAGYISPINSDEIKERETLQEYEEGKAKKNKSIYFKRVVLAAEIVNQLHNERTFGRVKFQKLVYLCENICKMDLHQRYAKFAAGPFDNKFMHTINREFKRLKWFDVEQKKEGTFYVQSYKKLGELDSYKEYYNNYFSDFDSSITRIINIFRKTKTREVELVATIFACLLELSKFETPSVTEENIINEVYSWSKEKQKYSRKEIILTYGWMCTNQLIPRSN